ncbi:MAG TPA: DNA ligase D [Burkholderiaceae bacterium]|jgi:bifunctional non-homologous end joining protein LigD
MSDRLQDYRRKRNFDLTSEPSGKEDAAGRKAKALSFVIQKHAARALHYDFRLELDGSLKSWAVPKGPSLDPQDKRMAVHVEDHPLSYASFEGTIPAGQYGAGTVIVWDRGTWLPIGDPHAGYKAGKLKFELHGEKLQGHWTLVRMRGRGTEKQEPWLLIKERDKEARPASEFNVVEAQPDSVKTQKKGKTPRKSAALPLTLAPQLATLVDAVPKSDEWLWELKFDGYRLLTRVDGGEVRLFTRNGHDWTSKLKGLAKQIASLSLGSAWLDGEIVVLGSKGAPDFQALQNAFDSARTEDIVYYVFDLPFHAGEDLRSRPLRERRSRLRELLGDDVKAARIRYSEDFAVAPAELLHTACELRMEGLIGKRADSSYVSRRSADWIKLKCTQRQEFVIAGYTDPKGSRQGLGALLLAVHDKTGALRYAGDVGSGFSDLALRSLTEKLKEQAAERPPFEAGEKSPISGKVHWVKPKLVAEVSFSEWTKEGRVRHAVFHGLRGDKPASVISREEAVTPTKTPTKTKSAPTALPAKLKLTHPDRVIDQSTGITKLELAEYYAGAAKLMLPHLKERPVALVRAPDGIDHAQLFFQKHAEGLKVPGLKLLDRRLDPGHAPLLEIANAGALLGAVQMNVIEFHTWNARAASIEKPDRMTFDLDPGEGVAWPRIQEAAQLMQTLLEELSLVGFLKTSGGKGLHIIVPFRPTLGWAAMKGLSQAVVQHMAATLPQRFVAKSGPKNRVGKIYVDYLRNGRGATTASAWSARARPGMGVSVPVEWSELKTLKSGAHWTVRDAAERLALKDAWHGYSTAGRQSLKTAMRVLDFVLPSEK